MFEKCDYQIEKKNEWFLIPASLMAKVGLVFVLTLENYFFLEVSL